MAVPICVATADTSFWSPALNGVRVERSLRLTTPSGGGSPPPGAVQRIGTESISPLRTGASVSEPGRSRPAIIAWCVLKTRALMLLGSAREIGVSSLTPTPSAATGTSWLFAASCTISAPLRAPTVSESSWRMIVAASSSATVRPRISLIV